jgi:hypothetical protein
MQPQDFTRLVNNFYSSKGLMADAQRFALDAELINYVAANQELKKFKVAFVFICLNPLYWQFANEMVLGARQFFLPGHNTEFFFWTDIPETREEIIEEYKKGLKNIGMDVGEHDITSGAIGIQDRNMVIDTPNIINGVANLRSQKDIHLIPTEMVEWPYPTLLRYNLFLQEEEKLKEFDYIFYCDVDMKFVAPVGDEILCDGITAAVHPGYHIRKELHPPIESNPNSASYIKQNGKTVFDEGGRTANGQILNSRFLPLYYAGGFQGGKAEKFIEAMKGTKKIIEEDLNKSYIPRWNDESAWNRYLYEHTPDVVLSPSYIYPDSLIKEYYEPIVWGCSYFPKLITVTKWFSLSKEGGQNLNKMLGK